MDNPNRFKFRQFEIPDYMREALDLYVKRGIPPGDFLTAVISNNLTNAIQYADDVNMSNLPAYINFFYNHAPSSCWGSSERMEAWIKKFIED